MTVTWKKLAYSDHTHTTLDGTTLGGTTPVKFGTGPTVGDFAEGKLYYDALWKTLSLEAGRDSTLQVGQEEWRRVYNTGAKILNGQPVYSTGVYSGGTPHVITVALADATASAPAFVLGIATQDIDTNNYGFVTVRGNINGLKTDHAGWTVGDSLYLSGTAGLLTNVKPEAPLLEVRVGRVIDVHATLGIINVRISQVYQLDNLSDVAVSGVVANQILKFDGVSWIPADSATTVSAGGTNFFLTDSDSAIEGLSRAAACVVTWTGHGLVDSGHQVKFEGITQAGWTALNTVSPAANLWHTATVINENSFSIPVNTSGYAAAYVPASDPGTYSLGKLIQTPDGTISESIDSAQSTGNVEALLDVYASPAALGRTTIEGGEWTFDTWCYASSTTDTNVIVIRVFKRSAAGSETELFNLTTADLGTTVTLSRIATVQPAFTILATDHLVVRYFAKSNRGSGLYRQFYLVHGGTTHYSLFKSPLAVAHNQLGGLNTTGYRHLPAAVADSDFAVGQASDGNWIKKTLAETKTILGTGIIWNLVSVDANAIDKNGYMVNASSGNVTITLPATPATGATVAILDAYHKASTNVITVGRNLNNIEALAEDLIINVNGAGFILVYVDATRGWEIASEVGSGAASSSAVEIDAHTAQSPSAAQLATPNMATIHNYDQAAADINNSLPATAANLGFMANVATAQAGNYWRFTAASAGTIYLNGSATGKDYVQYSAPAVGNYFSAYTMRRGAAYVWVVTDGIGSLATN